jgi:hypothetical protein
VLQWTHSTIGKHTLGDFVYGFFQLLSALAEKHVLGELHSEPNAVVIDNEVVDSGKSLVVQLSATKLLPEMF